MPPSLSLAIHLGFIIITVMEDAVLEAAFKLTIPGSMWLTLFKMEMEPVGSSYSDRRTDMLPLPPLAGFGRCA